MSSQSDGREAQVLALQGPLPALAVWSGAAIGASSLAVSGLLHIHLWMAGYQNVPIIGILFIVQGILALVFAAAVLLWRYPLVFFAASLYLLATVAGLLVSVYFGLFGFRDSFAAPYAKESVVVELVGALALGTMSLLARRRR